MIYVITIVVGLIVGLSIVWLWRSGSKRVVVREWQRTERTIIVKQLAEEDPHLGAVVAACWEHGGAVTGTVSDDGELTIVKHDDETDDE